MAVKIPRGKSLNVINLTSMLDVIFQLLIFFVVATEFSKEDREMNVELPTASEAKPLIVQPQEIFVNITDDGKIFSGGKEYSITDLEEHLAEAARNNPANQSVILRADKRVELDKVVQVINTCNRVGVSHSLTTANE
jgi:biopolymer transport protein ExbD